MRILIVFGKKRSSRRIADALTQKGFTVDITTDVDSPRYSVIKRFDVIFGIYLQECYKYVLKAKLLGKRTFIYFIGSDSYFYKTMNRRLRKLKCWLAIQLSEVIYVSDRQRSDVGKRGEVIPFPLDERYFGVSAKSHSPSRDILYYCPNGKEELYHLSWILDYARLHKNKKVTIIGNNSNPARYTCNLPNVDVIPCVDQDEMQELYSHHKWLFRMTIRDGSPRMVDEALLMGLKVNFNGVILTKPNYERHPKIFAEKVMSVLYS